MRIAKTIGIIAAVYAFSIAMELIMATSSPDYEGGMSVLIILTSLAIGATKVGYRWFDCFFALIPFYGVFFIFRIAYRLAFLPNVDWKLRQI
jgi:hypothetical protein